jgi:hypothetical protein
MLVKSPGMGTCVTNRIELVGPACRERAVMSDRKKILFFMATLSAINVPIKDVIY